MFSQVIGNYGGAWWHQNKEFESFNGAIVLTTNFLIPIKKNNTDLDRLFTTGVVNYPGAKHVANRPAGGAKDFSAVVERARKCAPPQEIESGKIVGGFAHNQVLDLADKVIDAVKSGAVKRFVVMAGCDGRQKSRSYFTEVAENLPKDTVILTAGCAKYRYNKLDLGDIGGIPRVLDAGQGLSEHTAPFDAMVHILDGEAEITIGGQPQVVVAGEMLIMPANVAHALHAKTPFKMLLVMIRGE